MKNIPMADRRLGRSIVLVLSTALISGYRNLQRSRQAEAGREPRGERADAPRRAEPRRH